MKNTIRLVQINHPSQGRKIALVEGESLRFLSNTFSVYKLALQAINSKKPIKELIQDQLSETTTSYDDIYHGQSAWKLLPSFDHPDNSFACLVSGTGLTHKNSAMNRQMMHIAEHDKLTDSMKMYQWGVEGGQPQSGIIGVQPEWFYKGPGSILRAHGEVLEVPAYANDGGEEPEVAGVYVIDEQGQPYRVGFTTGNEFSDHVMERKNYLYLAPSKLRQCAIGPELVIDADFGEMEGTVSVERKGEVLWSHEIKTGEKNMAHSLANLEYHHFKYESHRIPGQAHVHFYGADAFSFGQGVRLENHDVMIIEWKGLGRPLQNPLRMFKEEEKYIAVESMI
jgi:hypothetical protein